MFDRIDRPLLGVLIGLALLLTPAAAAQTTWYVDDDAPGDPGPGDPMISDPDEDGSAEHPFDAVQEGIDAATDGDTVLVADGTYTGVGNKNLDYDGKAVTVSGASGDPTMCIIDSENDGRGFYFHTGEGSDSIVEGMTITNGYVSSGSPGGRYGGGVCCMDGSSPTLTSCTISGNSAHYGGGVSCRDGSNPTLTNCRINGNSDDNFGFGGGVYCFNYSSPTLINCTISGNSASSGGGVLCWSSNPMITNCTISGNSASNGGGGVGGNTCSPTRHTCPLSGQ